MKMAAINYSYAGRNLSSPGNTNLGNIADDSETTKAVKTFVLSSLIAVAISGNSLVIASVYRNINKRMRVASNFLVVNLSIADFFLAIFSLSRLIGLTYIGFEWPFGGVFGLISCKAYNFFIAFLLYVSTINFMAIAFDRFVAVFFPLSGIMKGKLLYFVIALTWIIPGCFFSFFWKMMNIEVRLGIRVCYANVLAVFPSVKAFFNFLFAQHIIVIGIPIATTVALYAAIGVKLRQRRPPGNQQEVSVVQSELIARRVVRMMVTVILVFCLCWSPLWIISTICNSSKDNAVCRNPDVEFLKFVVAYSNSAITPFVYPFFSANFRESYKQILRNNFCRKCGRVSPQLTSVRGTVSAHRAPVQSFPLQGRSSN